MDGFYGLSGLIKKNGFSQKVIDEDRRVKFFYVLKHARDSIPVVQPGILDKPAAQGRYVRDQEEVGADYSPFIVMHKIERRDLYAMNDNGKHWMNLKNSGRRFAKRHLLLKPIGKGKLRLGPTKGQLFILPKDFLDPTRDRGRKSFLDLLFVGGGFSDTSQNFPWFVARNKTMESKLLVDADKTKYKVGEGLYKYYSKEYNRKIFF